MDSQHNFDVNNLFNSGLEPNLHPLLASTTVFPGIPTTTAPSSFYTPVENLPIYHAPLTNTDTSNLTSIPIIQPHPVEVNLSNLFYAPINTKDSLFVPVGNLGSINDRHALLDSNAKTLTSSKDLAVSQIQNFLNRPDYLEQFKLAFGQDVDRTQLDRILQDWQAGGSKLPKIEILSPQILGKADGGYDTVNNRIYLSSNLIERGNLSAIVPVIIEEFGHYLDSKIHPNSDAPGDEGEIFSKLVRGVNISATEYVTLINEDDHAIITVSQENDHNSVFWDGHLIPVEQSSLDLAGNTISTARIVTIGATATSFTDFVGDLDRDDYYKFTLANGGNLSVNLTGLSADANLRLLDSTGNFVTGSFNAGAANDSFQRSLLAGTYYVQASAGVKADFSGFTDTNYALSFQAVPLPVNPMDNAGNTLDTAKTITVGSTATTFNDSVWNLDTDDYYKFTLANGGNLSVNLTGLSADANLRLLDSTGNFVTGSFNAGAANDSFQRSLLAGTYYVQASAGVKADFSGFTDTNYALSFQAVPLPVNPMDNAGNTLDTAKTITVGSTATTFNDSVWNLDTDDYYKFTLANGGNLSVNLTGLSADANLRLLDSTGNFVTGSFNAGAANDSFQRSLLAGTYYVQASAGVKADFSGFTDTNYSLNLSFAASQILPTITVAATDPSAGETATGVTPNPGTFTLTRTGDLTQALTVNYTIGGTATKGTDYTNLTGTVSFAAGAATTLVNITPIDDTLAEGNETAVLTLATGTGYTVGTANTGTVTVVDNEVLPTITVAATDSSAAEVNTGQIANPGQFTLTRTGNTTAALTVNYTLSGTATKGTDYTNLTGTVSFAAGAATTLVNITPIDDTLAEGNETAVLTLATGTGYTVGTANTGTVTVVDNEVLPTITVAATDPSAGETATGVTPNPGTFTLTRTGNLTQALTVNYTIGGTATKGTDYTNLTGTVSFAAGAATTLVNITPIDDTLAEGNETAVLTLATGTGYTVGTANTGTVTVVDNEVLPTITVAATDPSAGETATGVTPNPGTFTLTRTGDLTQALTVNYTIGGTATKGTDYTNLTGTVSFAAGAATTLVNITPIDDTLAEGNETAVLTLATGTGYTVGTANTGTVTVVDNEVLPTITVAATDPSAGETATGVTPNPGTFTLTRTGNLTQALTVNYTIGGTATKGTDYTNLTGTVSFAAGAATTLVNITPIDDTLAEGNETAVLTLATGTGYTVGTANTGTVTVVDNEVLPTITVAATDPSAGETATGVTPNPGTFTLTRTGDLTQALTVNYTIGGTATKGTDYTNLTGTVSFAAGAATTLVNITPIDDTLAEGNETAVLTLATGTGYTVGTANTGTVTVVDNEVLPTITVAATDPSAGETATGVTPNPGTFTLTRTGDLTQALTVNYTIGGTATKGTDYTNLTGTVSFAAGAATTLVNITPIDDTLAEGNETAVLTLATGTGYTVGTANTGTVTVVDNEVLPTITVAATDPSAGETATGVTPNPGTFTLTRTGDLTQALTVNYTIGGTATKGTDYTNLTGTVSFAAGAATTLVNITPIDDTLAEGNETAVLTLATGTGYTVGTANTGTVTVVDNEVLPTITVAATDSSAAEVNTGQIANPGQFTLTRTGNTTAALTVNYTLSGTATKGTDYSNLTGTANFAAGAATVLVNITPIDDTLTESNENETVILTLAAGTGYTVGTTKTGTVTIADNEGLENVLENILLGLSSTVHVFAGLNSAFDQNPLLLKNPDLLGKRTDINTAKSFLNDAKIHLDQVITDLNSSSSLNLKTIVDQLSKAINSVGTVTVSIDGQLIASGLLGGVTLNRDSEVVFNFDFSKLFAIAESLTGIKTFSVAGIDTNATFAGNANGSASLGFKFSLGIDKFGKAFVNEGGLLSAIVDLNTTLAGSASIQGLANGSITGTGKLSLNTLVKIDDGDTIANERLYLTGNLGTLFATNGVSFAGGINLNSATIKGNIANLSGFEIPVAATGSLNFVTGKAELTIQQDALLDALVNAAEKGIGSLANQSAKVAQFTKNIPLIGSNLSTALASTITKSLAFDAPSAGTKAYLASRSITVEKIITPQQFFSGNFLTNDVLLLRYNPSISDILQLANTSGGFDAGLAKFTLNGNLQATPNLALDVRFGLDLVNGPFILEGGTITAQLPITGSFNGTASIGKLLTGQVNISNASLNPTAKLTFSDFDTVADERFYLLGSNNQLSLDTILGKKEAISLTGNLALDAALTVSNPAQNLKIPLLDKLNLGSFGWNATVQYDFVTGKATYTIKDDPKIAAIVSLFKGNEQGIIDLFLGDLITSNPLPESVRKVLTTKIPLLDKTLLDIIGVPEAAQLLINPEKFKGKNLTQINQNGIKLSLDFFSASSIVNLLSGNDLNLISLDIKQAFTAPTQKIPVIVTPVFSAFGVINVIADVGIEAKASLLIDTTIGFDTLGFYVLESGSVAPSGRTVGNMLFSLNPELSAILTGTLLVTALPLIDISGKISLLGQIGIRLDEAPFKPATDLDPKVRLAGLTNLENLNLAFAIDLGLGLTSTLLPVGNFGIPLIEDGEVQKIVPLYNGEAGSIADITNDVKSFIDKTKLEGALYLYALGIITVNPILTTAATSIAITSPQASEAFSALGMELKNSGRDMLGAAKDIAEVVKEYGINFGQTAKFLYEQFAGGVTGVANALYKEVTQDIGDIAKGLYNGVTQDLRSIARGLYNGVTTSLDSIAKAIYSGVIQDIDKIAKAIIDEFGSGFFFSLGNLITQFLPDGSKIRDTFINGAQALKEEWLSGGKQISTYFANGSSYLRDTFINGAQALKEEWLSGGKQISTYFANGSSYLRNTFVNGAQALKEEWLSGGKQISTYFANGSSYLRDTFINGAQALKEEWLSGGKQISTYFANGSSYLRNTFVNGAQALKEEWLSGGKQISTYFANGSSYLRNTFVNGAQALKEEWLSGGKQISTYFANGSSYLRNTFVNGAQALKEEWLSGGKQISTYFANGSSYLRNAFVNGVNTFREEWQSGGKKLETSFRNGTSYLRNTFVNGENVLRQTWESSGNYIEDAWDSAGNYLGRNIWNSAGNFISGVGNTVNGWVNTVKSWF